MLKEMKRWIKKLRGESHPAYDVPVPIGSPANAVSSWRYSNEFTRDVAYAQNTSDGTSNKDNRIEKKPVDVVNRIIAEKPSMDLNDLDRQIRIVQRRRDIMEEVNGNIRDEDMALIFLKSRQKYRKVEKLFTWAVTTQDLIETLCKEYKVMCADFAGYSRNVPQEGLDQLELYFEAWHRVVPDKKPTLKLIVDQGGKEQKKDPILLAQSPFGNWWYILGAWDKEVEIVDDLVYQCK